jgi:hypothetical protein
MAKHLPVDVLRIFQNVSDARIGIIERMKLELRLNVEHLEMFGKHTTAARRQHLPRRDAMRGEIFRADLVEEPPRPQLCAASQSKTVPDVIV